MAENETHSRRPVRPGECDQTFPPIEDARVFQKEYDLTDATLISCPDASGAMANPYAITPGMWSLVDRRRPRPGCKTPAPMDNPPEPAAFPRCVACGETMRLITIEPAYFYRHLDEHAYACRCGASLATFVRRDPAGD